MEEKVVILNKLIKQGEVNRKIQKQIDKKSEMYAKDFERLKHYIEKQGLDLSFTGLELYLSHTD